MTIYLNRAHRRLRACLTLLLCCCAVFVPALALAQDATKPAEPAPAPAAATPDPIGSDTGKSNALVGAGIGSVSQDELDELGKAPDAPASNKALLKAFDATGQTAVSLNFVWMLITGFMVMFMQAGFAMVEAGMCRAKNASHVIMTNFLIYPIGMLGFWICGFAFMFGSVGGLATLGGNAVLNGTEFAPGGFGLLGTKGFFLGGDVYDVAVYGFFLFQMVFMDTTATIPTGAMAERWRFTAFIIYGFFISMVCYPIYGHMVWGGGGLATLGTKAGLGHGVVDFAGSSVVHAVGGWVALAGAIVIGPRKGKYNADGTSNVIKDHHIPMATIGAFILAFGWFGFNPGSALAASGGNLRVAIVAVNTMLASAGGAMAAAIYMKLTTKKYDPGMMINGLLAGLVAITAPCAFVNATSSVVIGVIAGVLVIWSVNFVDQKLKIDDPVGAFSVHGVCGIWGLVSIGIFADGKFGDALNGVKGGVGGIMTGDSKQLVAQLIGAVVCIVWSFGTGWLFFTIQKKLMRIRSTEEEEDNGVDIPEMGVTAYPEFGV